MCTVPLLFLYVRRLILERNQIRSSLAECQCAVGSLLHSFDPLGATSSAAAAHQNNNNGESGVIKTARKVKTGVRRTPQINGRESVNRLMTYSANADATQAGTRIAKIESPNTAVESRISRAVIGG